MGRTTCEQVRFLDGATARSDGAPGRNRTCDPALRRRVLYPLSYRGGEAILAEAPSQLLGPGMRVSLQHLQCLMTSDRRN